MYRGPRSKALGPIELQFNSVMGQHKSLGNRNISFDLSGVSANADPHYQKLRTRVTHIWGNRRRQPNRSAMVRSLPGESHSLIWDYPVPGKYELVKVFEKRPQITCVPIKCLKKDLHEYSTISSN